MEVQPAARLQELSEKRNAWWKRPITWAGVVILVGGGFTYWIMAAHGGLDASDAAFQVRWVTVQRGSVSQSVSLSGTLTPVSEVQIENTGKLLSVSVKPGDVVQKGQVIAHLDDSSLQNQLTQAQAQLASAQAKLAQSQETATSSGQRGATAPDPNVVAQAQAAVTQAQAQVDSVEQQMAACTVTSPISGTVLSVANPNVVTTSSQSSSQSGGGSSGGNGGSSGSSPIAVIADLSPSDFEVDATVDQTDAANIKAGQTAEISLSTSGSPSLTGQVENISYLPETQSGVTVYPVTIRVDNPNNSSIHLLPGQTVSVSVVEQQAKQVLMVPAAALTQRRGTVGVYVKAGQGTTSNNDTTSSSEAETGSRVPVGLQFQPVTVGLYGGNEVEIKSGLTEGEQVAVVTQTATTTTGATRSGNTGLGGMLGGAGGIGFGGQGGAGGRGVLGGGYAGRGGYGGVGGAGGGYNGARSGGGN